MMNVEIGIDQNGNYVPTSNDIAAMNADIAKEAAEGKAVGDDTSEYDGEIQDREEPSDEPCEDPVWADANALASAGMGTDEDYGGYDNYEAYGE